MDCNRVCIYDKNEELDYLKLLGDCPRARMIIAKRGVDFLVYTGSQVSLISNKLACVFGLPVCSSTRLNLRADIGMVAENVGSVDVGIKL